MHPDKSQFTGSYGADLDAKDKANMAAAEKPFNNEKKHQNILDENQREMDTREAARDNVTIGELMDRKESGDGIEISGDALARIRAGKPGKWQDK